MRYFDCHADTLTEITKPGEDLERNTCDLDLERVEKFADSYTQIFAIWRDRKKMDEEKPEEEFLRLYRRAAELLEKADQKIIWCRNAQDMEEAHKSGKAAAFLSLEDISTAGRYAEQIYSLGFRFAMLTWNYENRYACGASADQRRGLTEEGKELVKHLIDQGIILDISHLSDRGAEDLMTLTDKPIIASHSNVRSVCSRPRNLPEGLIRELIRRQGLIGINFFAPFVGENPQVEDLLRHMDVIFSLGGEDVLALGGDLDGCDGVFPAGISGVETVPVLRERMEKAGFGAALIEKVFFENAENFIRRNVL
ncbi:MAG TPA: membrane dipeptidase [Candidatus Mediterraneibacter vanvlietii]|nr:membrane dipeptidase [Candidatus Mediterraneibacter vanvlietii]